MPTNLPEAFYSKLKDIGRRHNFDPAHAVNVFMYESNMNPEALHPTAPAGGIFQKFFSTREEAEKFAQISAVQQLDAYDQFMAPYARLPKTAPEHIYQLNFLPASAIPGTRDYRGTDDDAILAARGGDGYGGREDLFYRQNAGLDVDKDGSIRVSDLRLVMEKQRARPDYAQYITRLVHSPGIYVPMLEPASTFPLFPIALGVVLLGGAYYAYSEGYIHLPKPLRRVFG